VNVILRISLYVSLQLKVLAVLLPLVFISFRKWNFAFCKNVATWTFFQWACVAP